MNDHLTHGGGIVVRQEENEFLYLVITASKNPNHWVLPKGHIEPGESPEETAVREVMEETGVQAEIIDFVGTIQFTKKGKPVRAGFYLMNYLGQSDAEEDREKKWCTYREALRVVTFTGYREMIGQADKMLTGDSEHGAFL